MSVPILIVQVPATRIDALDRGLHYGDGLFETIACRGGQPRFLPLHLERLASGCSRLGIAFEAFAQLGETVQALAASEHNCLIKLILTRGTATARGYGPHGDERPRTVLLKYPWPQDDGTAWEQGVVVRTAAGYYGENPLLAGLKHLNRLEQVLIRREWSDPQIHEALVFSSSGWLISGTMSNVFLVRDHRLMTPALGRAGISGIMRRVVLREAQQAGLEVCETDIDAAQARACDELFLTNARIGIWPVREWEGARPVGPMTRLLQQRLRVLLEPAHA